MAIGGPALFAFLTIVAVLYLRRKDQLKRKRAKELEDAETGKENGVRPRSTRGTLRLSQRSSFNPFLLPERSSTAMSNEWLEDESMMDSPPMTKAQARRLSQKGMFQVPRIRDSWPLAASMPNVPLRLLQPNSSMVTLNQVGGGGYVVPPEAPKWPGRTYSRRLKTKVVVSTEEPNIRRFSERSLDMHPKRPTHRRRSASVDQLSTILRSTSQRLRAAHRKSLSRTLTTFGGPTGPPPTDKLETPHKAASESREALIDLDGDDEETVASSICDTNYNPSPKPRGMDRSNSCQGSLRRQSSVTPSESMDSLFAGATPDLVIPAALTSPSKKLMIRPQRHAIQISSASAKDLSAMIRGEGRAMALELDTQGLPEEKAAFTSPHRISLAGDQFYSAVTAGKRAVSQNKIIGPRPLYMRHTTFGQEATLERPASFVSTSSSSSPLRNISGNVQSSSSLVSSSSSMTSESNPNPFSWDPELLMGNRQQNPSRTGSRRKGHKRSNVLHMSLLPRPPYTSPLPEEPEDESSPLKFKIPLNAPMRTSDPAKSPSPNPSSMSSHRLSTRPPSINFFNPVLSIPELAEQRDAVGDSPTLGSEVPPQIYSPTLSVSNYYSEGHTSEDDFFNAKPVKLKDSSIKKIRQPNHHHTIVAFPAPEHKELFSFPPLSLNTSSNPHLSLPPPRPRSSTATSSRLTSPMLLKSPPSLPAPPVLTQSSPTPSHLNGPRSEPRKGASMSSLGPRDSLLHQSICLLRRMNSEVSRCSSASNDEEEGRSLPRLPPKVSPDATNWGRRFERQGRGSKAYLSIGMGDSQGRSRVGKHQSGRRNTISEQQKVKEEDEEQAELIPTGLGTTEETKSELKPTGLEGKEETKSKLTSTGLETKEETKSESPNLASDQVKQDEGDEETLKLPTLTSPGETGPSIEKPARKDSLTTELVTPTSPSQASVVQIQRWSDATPSPTIRVIRHESQLLQPSPQSPPAWGWSKSHLGKEVAEGIEDVKENLLQNSPAKEHNANLESNFGRPDSLGLYDADGFLKSSPEKAPAAGS